MSLLRDNHLLPGEARCQCPKKRSQAESTSADSAERAASATDRTSAGLWVAIAQSAAALSRFNCSNAETCEDDFIVHSDPPKIKLLTDQLIQIFTDRVCKTTKVFPCLLLQPGYKSHRNKRQRVRSSRSMQDQGPYLLIGDVVETYPGVWRADSAEKRLHWIWRRPAKQCGQAQAC